MTPIVRGPKYLRRGSEQRVDRRTKSVFARSSGNPDPARLDEQVMIGRSNVNAAGEEALDAAGTEGGQRAGTRQNFVEHAG